MTEDTVLIVAIAIGLSSIPACTAVDLYSENKYSYLETINMAEKGYVKRWNKGYGTFQWEKP